MNSLTVFLFSNHRGIRILRHSLFWVADILSYLSVISINREINLVEVYSILMKITPIIGVTYFILYYLLPNASRINDKRILLLWIISIVVFIGLGIRLYNYYLVNPLLNIKQRDGFNLWDFRLAVSQVFSSMTIICIAITIKLTKSKVAIEQSNQLLMAEKKAAELNFLRAQMQPHFLFNTLNTLYSETIKESGKAQNVVLHLSSLLRFILDECNKPLIPLGKELKVIQDFVALEKLRHGTRLQVTLNLEDTDPTVMISPLVFLPFVENSFKHTLANQITTIHIDILVKQTEDNVHLIVENDDLSKKDSHVPNRGMGLQNIERQLDLLYGKSYSLTVNGKENKHYVSLVIPAKSHVKN